MDRYDAVIVGGGHNGLVAAGYLAKAGVRTLVLERRNLVGGACVTEEPWPGFRINTYSYVAGMLRPEIIDDLELRRFGFRTLVCSPAEFCPFPDGRSLCFWRDDESTLREIAKFSRRDAATYPKYVEYWERTLDILEPLLLLPPAPLPELLAQFQSQGIDELLRDLFLLSVEEFLDGWFESDQLKASLAINGLIGEMCGPRTPGTAYVLAHHNATILDGERQAWGFAEGGMGRITEAMARAAEYFGATIRRGTGVRQVRMRDGRAVGVETEAGEAIEARVVLSGLDVRRTMLKLVPPDVLSSGELERVRRFRSDGASLKFNAALNRLPNFTAWNGPGIPHTGEVEIAPSMEYLERAYDAGKYGRFSEHPYMDILFQSAADPSMAPPGKHTMTCFVQYAPYKLRGTTWDDFKPEAGEIVLQTLEQYAPEIRNTLEHSQVISPVDIERTVGLSGGNIFQGNMTPDQIFRFRPLIGWSGYRTPIPGLYLCAATAHPGGGVMGAPGHNAAQVVLEDLRASPSADSTTPGSR
ncbi:MAG: NAD(P)/FAD-dependent oxidoreductase [Thermoplasmata archaeon]|nr:NAD(P)/FAD-dependent oxidoreductase [Thermoplasmata archaeon]